MVDYLKGKNQEIVLSCGLDYFSHLSTTLNEISYLFKKALLEQRNGTVFMKNKYSRELARELSLASP